MNEAVGGEPRNLRSAGVPGEPALRDGGFYPVSWEGVRPCGLAGPAVAPVLQAGVVWSKRSTVVGSNGSREAQGFYRLIWKV